MSARGDDDLLRAVARREPAALTVLYDRHGRVAFGLAYRILRDADTAEEVVQDAFLRVWQHGASFDPALGSVRTWLLAIVRHRAIDARRGRQRRHGQRQADVGLDAVAPRLAVPDAWSEVALRLQRERVQTALRALPPAQRRAIELAYFEGLTHREIAARAGLPPGTVKGRLRLGLQKLRRLLGDDRPASPPASPRRVPPVPIGVPAVPLADAEGVPPARDAAVSPLA